MISRAATKQPSQEQAKSIVIVVLRRITHFRTHPVGQDISQTLGNHLPSGEEGNYCAEKEVVCVNERICVLGVMAG